MKKSKIPHLLTILLMFMWGISYPSIKVVVNEIEPSLSAFYRFIVSSIILYIILKVKFPEEKLLKEDRLRMALGGLFGVALYFFFENYSVLFTSASNVAILISSIPVFTLISQAVFFKEKMPVSKILGALLSFAGIIIIVTSKGTVSLFSKGMLGDLMALAAALSWVVYNVLTSKFKGNYNSLTISAYQGLWGCLFLSPSLFFSPIGMPSAKAVLNLLYLSLGCTCFGYVLYIYCLKRLGATVLSTYINLQPIISLVFAYLLLKESVTPWQVAGSIVIILGVFLVNSNFSFRKSTSKPEEVLEVSDDIPNS